MLHAGPAPPRAGSGSSGPSADGGAPGGSDGGGGTGSDAGQGGGTDAGTGSDGGSGGGGGSGSGGQDGGTTSSDCDGLVPGTPGAPSEFRWMNRDLNSTSGGYCGRGETDGTGHIALSWQDPWQPHDSKYAFLDPATGSQVGSYDKGTRLVLIGQASGFMGGTCAGSICAEN